MDTSEVLSIVSGSWSVLGNEGRDHLPHHRHHHHRVILLLMRLWLVPLGSQI